MMEGLSLRTRRTDHSKLASKGLENCSRQASQRRRLLRISAESTLFAASVPTTTRMECFCIGLRGPFGCSPPFTSSNYCSRQASIVPPWSPHSTPLFSSEQIQDAKMGGYVNRSPFADWEGELLGEPTICHSGGHATTPFTMLVSRSSTARMEPRPHQSAVAFWADRPPICSLISCDS